MYVCTTGQLETQKKGDNLYYRIRLNLTDEYAVDRKHRYKNKYILTDLIVGGKTNRISNDKLANEMLTRAIREYTPVGSGMLFNQYCAYWLENKKADHTLAVTTKEGYEYKVGHIINYFEGKDLTLADITTSDLKDFQNSLYEIKKCSPAQKNETGLSDRTVRDIMVLVKQIFTDAISYGHLRGENPSVALKLPKKKKKEDDLPYISEAEIPIFKEALRQNCDGQIILESAYLIGLFYGLRREEICGLKWSALRHGDIHIEHTVTRMKTTVARDGTKTDASHRSCAILPQVQKIFDTIQKEQQKNKILMGNTYLPSDYIFTWKDGRQYTPDYLTKKFRKIIDCADGLDKRLHLHDLRVSCVSILVNNGVNIKDVQKWVGHEDIKTTMDIYARTNRKRQYETGQLMENILF